MATRTDTPLAAERSLGIITGLVKEAACVRRSGNSGALMVQAVAGQSDRATAAAEAMLDHGASGLVSFGVAGGLDPSLGAGVVVIASSVIGPKGQTWETDEHWVDALMQIDGAFDCGAIVGSNAPVMTALEKRKLFRRNGALAVDMESHAVADVAHRTGVPFAAIRAVGDPASRSIPRTALSGLTPNGRTRALPVIAGLLRRPGDFADIWRLAKETNKAMQALKYVVEASALDRLR